MYLKLLIVAAAFAHAMDISDLGRDSSDPYLKRGKLDFGTSHEASSHEVTSHVVPALAEHSHESDSGFYDSDKKESVRIPATPVTEDPSIKTQTDRKFEDTTTGDDQYHKLHSKFHGNFHGHDYDYNPDHGFSDHGFNFDNAPESKDIMEGFNKNIDDQIGDKHDQGKHSVETLGQDTNSGTFGIIPESGIRRFQSSLGAENIQTNPQDVFEGILGRSSRDLESINVKRKDGREEHNLGDLQIQRESNNEYLDAILSDNRQKFDSESKIRQTFSNTGRTQLQSQSVGFNTGNEGSNYFSSGLGQKFDSNTGITNHFERRDVSDASALGDHTRRKSRNHDRRRVNQESEASESNRKTDAINDNRPKHKHEHRSHDERHDTRDNGDATEREMNTDNDQTSYSIPVVSKNDKNISNNRMNKSKSPETENTDRVNLDATHNNARKDQRPQFMTTTEHVMSTAPNKTNKTNDGERDEWIWSGQRETMKKEKNENSTRNEGDMNSTMLPDLDDRAAFNGDSCPSGQVKIGSTCVNTD